MSGYIQRPDAPFGKNCMRNLYYVAIEGTIGVGKTSLAKLLADRLSAKLVLETFEDNPFLADFYDDPEAHAFQTQLWFLLQRYQQQQDLRQVDMFHNLIITDYMFVKDRLFASLNLKEKEMSLYDTVANMMERNVIHPDLVIFLQADADTLMRNISRRGRDFEKNISEDYIDALNQVYNEYFFRYQDTPLVIINTNNIDFVEPNSQQQAAIMDGITAVKAGDLNKGRHLLSKAYDLMLAQGADCVLFGCTEIPLVLNEQAKHSPDTCLDTIAILAQECVNWAYANAHQSTLSSVA
jgi:deoxyadenosine/deoxycytidine kinase